MRDHCAVLLFPMNWSACVSGPHLACPLLAGVARDSRWCGQTWDLSEEYFRAFDQAPKAGELVKAVEHGNFETLDELYFTWEDEIRGATTTAKESGRFRLLSGYSFCRSEHLPLREVVGRIHEGSVFTHFLRERIAPRLSDTHPDLVGVTIASRQQVVGAIELLHLVREVLPNAFLILGGNIVTRLRDTPAFEALTGLVDQTVVFQGDRAFANTLNLITERGVQGAREQVHKVVSEQSIPYAEWPVPSFNGIAFDQSIGTPTLCYVSTRGCYWGKCHFCAIPAGWSSTGYGGSAPAGFVADQLRQMVIETGIPRIKFVDEAIPPSKIEPLSRMLIESGLTIEWEGYVRLEPAFENPDFLAQAYAGGLRKLYFGLEQAPSTNRLVLNKNDHGDPLQILRGCNAAGIRVHLFCMVGHPGTSREDGHATARFLIENQELIDTADLVGFRLDRGTVVPGVRAKPDHACDWAMSFPFEGTASGVLDDRAVSDLEAECQEMLWDTIPRLLHPLYRIVGPWKTDTARVDLPLSASGQPSCSTSS